MSTNTYTLSDDEIHTTWSAEHRSRITVQPGDQLHIKCRDAFDGQLRDLDSENLDKSFYETIDYSRVAPLTGPVYVDGAQPGCTLEVEILHLKPTGVGTVLINPAWRDTDFLRESDRRNFQGSWLRNFELDHAVENGFISFTESVDIPIHPMIGTMGTAPAKGKFATKPAQLFGANMDVKDVCVGSRIYLPVQCAGALFSIGDGHAAQGDGELCTTAIECPMEVTVRFAVHERHIEAPQIETDKEFMCVGVGRSIEEASRHASLNMIEYLVDRQGLSYYEAYAFLSISGDIRINQVVNSPNLGARVAILKSAFHEFVW